MIKLLSSATRLVLLMLAITGCVAFLTGILPVDQFMLLAIAVFSYYFAKPVTPDATTTTTTVTAPKENTVETKVQE